MHFFNGGEIGKICGINLIWKLLKKRRCAGNGQSLSGAPLEDRGRLNGQLVNGESETVDSSSSYSKCVVLSCMPRNWPEAVPTHTQVEKWPEKNSLCSQLDVGARDESQATKCIWRMLGANLKESTKARKELVELLIRESGKGKHMSKLARMRMTLQAESEYRRVQEKMFGRFFGRKCLQDAWKEDSDFLDCVILECPSVWHFEKMLLSRDVSESSILGDLARCIFDRVTYLLNLNGDSDLKNIVLKVSKIGVISERMYRLLWFGGLEERLGKLSSMLGHFQLNEENKVESCRMRLLLELILIHGCFLAGEFGDNDLSEREVCTVLARVGELLREGRSTCGGAFDLACFLVEMIVLRLTGEAEASYELRMHTLRLFKILVTGGLSSDLMSRLAISNMIENFGIGKALDEGSGLYEEFSQVLNVFFSQQELKKRAGGDCQALLHTELELLNSKLDIEILESLLREDLIQPGKTRDAIELILTRVHDQLVSTLRTQKTSSFELSKVNVSLLRKVVENQEDERLSISYLDNCLISGLAKTVRILGQGKAGQSIKFKMEESGRVNLQRLISKINSAFDEFSGCRPGQESLIKAINCYNFPRLVQSTLRESASKNSCNWTLVSEGVRLLNNYLLAGVDCGLIDNVDEVFEFSKSIMKDIRSHFINDETNQVELKPSIPQSHVYFEVLRLIHNAFYVVNNNKGQGGGMSCSRTSVQLLSQGIVPFSLSIEEGEEGHPDFLISRVNPYFREGPRQREAVSGSSKGETTNLIFIHGFLGSAFRSWNIDISIQGKSPIIVDSHLPSVNISEYEQEDDSVVASKLRENSEIISKLDKSNYLIWPRILLGEAKDVNMFAVDYHSHNIFNQDKSATLKEISEEIYKKLAKANILPNAGKNDIIICHSMGGILLKLIMSNHPETLKSVRGIIFFGTPHFGTNLHSKIIRLLKRKVSPYIIELSSTLNLKDLRELNSKFQRLIYSVPKHERPLIYSFSENLPCKIPFMFNIARVIVPHSNSNPFVGNFYTLKTDHNFINKLTIYRSDVRFLLIKHLINTSGSRS